MFSETFKFLEGSLVIFTLQQQIGQLVYLLR
jgi:hypothetical protein